LNKLDKIKLADDLLKSGAKDESLILFKEGLRDKVDPSIPPEAYLNYGTALLEKGDVKEGLEVYKKLRNGLNESTESKKIKEMMDKNVLAYFQKQEQQKKEKSKGKDQDQEKDDKKNQGGSSNDQQKKQDGKSGKQDQKNKKSDDDVNQNPDKKENSEDKDKENKEEEKDKDKPEEEKKSDEDRKPLPPQKIPAKLKQLMSDDRQLQMKMIENGTKDLNRRKSRKSKDW
jgi:hypothetical protein